MTPPPPSDAPEAQGASGLADLTTAHQPTTGDAYDALTDLFLGPGNGGPKGAGAVATPDRPASRPAGRAPVEGLILGHLPVMASAWVMQYARSLAGASGAVAILRIRAGEVALELAGGAPPAEAAPDLATAIATAAPLARAWLVQVDESAERLLASSGGLDTLTLLTGADEAAIVSAYQALKDMLAPGSGPEVRLAIMGAAPDKGAQSAERIARTAGAFLGRKISVVACVSKIGPGRPATLFRAPLEGDANAVLEGALRSIRAPRPAHGLRPQVTVSAPPIPLEPQPTPASTPARAPTPARQASSPPMRPEPPAQRSLAQHLPGLVPLGFVCPYAPTIELALDDTGGMHLLAGADAGPNEGLAGMMAVSTWAIQHERLIELASAGVGRALDPTAPVTQHLFTADARRVRALLDAPIRLHLIAPVTVDGRRGWFCTELN
jgi:hypothetical protein